MLKVGLTGSIAVGKSFVCDVFGELGCHILDADQVARDLVSPGTKGLRQVVESFGNSVLLADGSLDRSKLGSIVFADNDKRKLLNSIVHPLVIDAQDEWMAARESEDPTGIAVIEAALIIEAGGYKRYDKLIVVWCKPEIQLNRLMLRDNLSPADASRRIASQMPQDEKKRYADFLIDTSNGFDETRRQSTEVFSHLSVLVGQTS